MGFDLNYRQFQALQFEWFCEPLLWLLFVLACLPKTIWLFVLVYLPQPKLLFVSFCPQRIPVPHWLAPALVALVAVPVLGALVAAFVLVALVAASVLVALVAAPVLVAPVAAPVLVAPVAAPALVVVFALTVVFALAASLEFLFAFGVVPAAVVPALDGVLPAAVAPFGAVLAFVVVVELPDDLLFGVRVFVAWTILDTKKKK